MGRRRVEIWFTIYLSRVVQVRSKLLTFPHIKAAQREVDDCWVLFLDEVVLGKALEVEDHKWRQALTFISAKLIRGYYFLSEKSDHVGELLCIRDIVALLG
jgi:hypothetical protein